jgi:hypothetical protein
MGESKRISNQDTRDALLAVKELNDLFKVERFVYIGIMIVSVIIQLISTTYIAVTKDMSTPALLGLYGPSAGLFVGIARLLRMWSESMKLISHALGKDDA